MNRLRGVRVSAVIAIVGSVISMLFGVFMLLGAVMSRTVPLPTGPDQAVPPMDPGRMLVIMASIYFGFGVWGVISAVGLWRLRNWARLCFLIYGGILALFSFCAAIGALMAPVFMPQSLPSDPNVSSELLIGTFLVIGVGALLCSALGIWWVIYFNRYAVKAQFLGEVAATQVRQFPLIISILGWLLIVGGTAALIMTFVTSYPLLMFGIVVRGWAARLVFLSFAGIGIGSGIGILKKRREAYYIAIAYFSVGILNVISYFVIPSSASEMLSLMQEMPGMNPQTTDIATAFFWPSLISGAVISTVPLWILLWQRKAFFEACSKG